jgi:hypothetical protein
VILIGVGFLRLVRDFRVWDRIVWPGISVIGFKPGYGYIPGHPLRSGEGRGAFARQF